VPPERRNPRLHRDLSTICLKCLRKNPSQRYATALALAEDLDAYLEGRPIHARPVGAWERAWKWARRRPAVAGLLVGIVLLAATVLVGLAVGLWAVAREQERTQQALGLARTAEIEAKANFVQAQAAEAATLTDYRESTDDAIEQLISSRPVLSAQEKDYLERTLKRWQAFSDRGPSGPRGRLGWRT
jgi:eukaryotic-like serine/threonine-protein kinase